jgi:rhamnogalacturonyl hydrolase YesR
MMKSKHWLFCLAGLITVACWAQPPKDDLDILKKLAAQVIVDGPYKIANIRTGEKYENTKGLPVDKEIYFLSPYVRWNYMNGVLNLAMLKLGRFTGDSSILSFPRKNYSYFFDQVPYFRKFYDANIYSPGATQFFKMELLDHCGAMGAGLIEVYENEQRGDYRDYIEKTALHILEKECRLEDGTLARLFPYKKTVWLDDLYMSVPFLARMGKLTGDRKYFDFAASQVIGFAKYLYDEKSELYFHCYYDDLKENGVARWGRANGWSIMAQCDLLEFLPENHPARDTLLQIFRRQVLGYSRYQSESGMWHQLIDKIDSYPETSCTAMFTYGVAKGVNEGWLDRRFSTIAIRGWEGIKSMMTPELKVGGICVGTGIQDDLAYYYTRPVEVNDNHGLGAVIMAGTEVLRMKQTMSKK